MTCEKCGYWNGAKCTDEEEFVNRVTGEPMCRYNRDAIPEHEYDSEQRPWVLREV
jgi:hypothetical protein